MKVGTTKKLQGFTIIEVLLVFAIAGLIFLMTFIALPALQRSTRDTERKQDIAYLLKEIKKYQTNNRGSLPEFFTDTRGEIDPTKVSEGTDTGENVAASSWAGFYRDYLKNTNFVDPLGSNYSLYVTKCNGTISGGKCGNQTLINLIENELKKSNQQEQFPTTIYIVTQAKCAEDENIGVLATSNPRKIAILFPTEQSGVYCANT